MKKQYCKVTNKKQLLAAIECTRDVPYPTIIDLVKKDGEIVQFKIQSSYRMPFSKGKFYPVKTDTLLKNIREIPANQLF